MEPVANKRQKLTDDDYDDDNSYIIRSLRQCPYCWKEFTTVEGKLAHINNNLDSEGTPLCAPPRSHVRVLVR